MDRRRVMLESRILIDPDDEGALAELDAIYRRLKIRAPSKTDLPRPVLYALTDYRIATQKPMDFRDDLIRHPEANHMMYPLIFDGSIPLVERLAMSIQASRRHYSTPQATLDPYGYTHFELAFNPRYYEYNFDPFEDLIIADEYLEGGILYGFPSGGLVPHEGGALHPFMSVEDIQEKFDFLRARFGYIGPRGPDGEIP